MTTSNVTIVRHVPSGLYGTLVGTHDVMLEGDFEIRDVLVWKLGKPKGRCAWNRKDITRVTEVEALRHVRLDRIAGHPQVQL